MRLGVPTDRERLDEALAAIRELRDILHVPELVSIVEHAKSVASKAGLGPPVQRQSHGNPVRS